MSKFGESRLRIAVAMVVGVCVGLGCSSAGHADFVVDSNRYCSAGWLPSTNSETSSSWLSVNDVALTNPQHKASNCYGEFPTPNSGTQTQTEAVNAIFGAPSGPDKFVYLNKHENGQPAAPGDPNGLGGIVFTILTSGGQDGAPGIWTISWEDKNGTNPSNLPLLVDLVVLLKGGTGNAVYLLSNLLLTSSPTSGMGTFDIQFFNGEECKDDGYHHYSYQYGHKKKKKKKVCKPRQPSLSHLSLFGRIVTTVEVPEPATMAMFGVGLFGLWTLRRRWSLNA